MAGVKTQGTSLYWRRLNGGTYSIIEVAGVTSIDRQAGSPAVIDVTPLDASTDESIAGNDQPGALNVGVNVLTTGQTGVADQRLFLRQTSGTESVYVVGLSDGTADVTVDAGTGVITYPTTRSYRTLTGSFQGFNETYAAKDAIRGTATIQQSGATTYNDKA